MSTWSCFAASAPFACRTDMRILTTTLPTCLLSSSSGYQSTQLFTLPTFAPPSPCLTVNDDHNVIPIMDNPIRRPFERLLRKLLSCPATALALSSHVGGRHCPAACARMAQGHIIHYQPFPAKPCHYNCTDLAAALTFRIMQASRHCPATCVRVAQGVHQAFRPVLGQFRA